MSNGFMIVLAPLAAYAPVVATGTGWSPLVYLAGGIIAALVGSAVLRRAAQRPWIGQLALLLATAAVAAGFGYRTSRPDPARLFTRVFGIPPPPGVTGLRGRIQWFDGQTIVLRFHAGAALRTIVAHRPFQLDEVVEDAHATGDGDRIANVIKARFNLANFADRTFVATIPPDPEALYEWMSAPTATRTGIDNESAAVVVDTNGDVWATYSWGS